MRESKIITAEEQRAIVNRIALVGGLQNASTILGISTKTLEKYSTIKGHSVTKRVWDEKISPFLGDEGSFSGLVCSQIKELAWDLERSDEERVRQERKMYKMHSRIKELELLLESGGELEGPIFTYEGGIVGFDRERSRLIEEVKLFRKDPDYSPFLVYHGMIDFGSLYQRFRPWSVDRDCPYWGTISKLDRIYMTLYSLIGSEPLMLFSTVIDYASVYYSPPANFDHSEADWDRIFGELEEVSRAIDLQAQVYAAEVPIAAVFNARRFTIPLIERYLQERVPGLDKESLVFSKSEGTVTVGDRVFTLSEYPTASHIRREIQRSE